MRRAVNLFDRLVVAVALNPNKHPLFSLEERVQVYQKCYKEVQQDRGHSF